MGDVFSPSPSDGDYMKSIPAIATAALLCAGCSSSPRWTQPTKEAAYAECMAHLERVKNHPDEQYFWNPDGDARVIRAWCEVDDTHPTYVKLGLGQVIPHLRYTSRRMREFAREDPESAEVACPRGVCTIYPGEWHTYPLKTSDQ